MTLLEALEAAEQQLSKIDDLIASRSRPAVGSPYSPEVQTWLTLGLVRHEALLRVCALQSLAAGHVLDMAREYVAAQQSAGERDAT